MSSSEDHSIWHKAEALQPDEVTDLALELKDEVPQTYHPSRLLTLIGTSANPALNQLTAWVEQSRFGEKFGNTPDELSTLYSHLGDAICILVLDVSDPANPVPAASSRICKVPTKNTEDLPTARTLVRLGEGDVAKFSDNKWHMEPTEYDQALMGATGGNYAFDAATIAASKGYENGSASMPLFTAYSRMTQNGYHDFEGIFLATIVDVVAGIVNKSTGDTVLQKIPGTTYEEFLGAKGTAPHLGVIKPERFNDGMQSRLKIPPNEPDLDNSTFLFL